MFYFTTNLKLGPLGALPFLIQYSNTRIFASNATNFNNLFSLTNAKSRDSEILGQISNRFKLNFG